MAVTAPETGVVESLSATRPADDHNRRLVEHVHPPDWTNPEPSGRYNLVVIGAGTAGLVTAAGAAGLGAKVALVERGLMGGDCLNVGCVPSKALIRCARAVHEARDARRFGVHVPEGVSLDFGAVMGRMRRLRSQLSHHDSAARFRELGVDVFIGEGDGFLKVHTRKGKDTILGATLVARHAGEMISEITAAMTAGAGIGKLAETIHCYPTQAEAIKKAADAQRRARLTPAVAKLFKKVLAWRR